MCERLPDRRIDLTPRPGLLQALCLVFVISLVVVAPARGAPDAGAGGGAAPSVEELFASHVDMRLEVPPIEQLAYAERLQNALSAMGLRDIRPQFFLLVDRSPSVQAALIYWYSPENEWRFIGASPVSTGQPGGFEHFLTPLGVFEHTLVNMDFRAEGTWNVNGIRGYGVRGMRVFDFGWIEAERTWGSRGRGAMRLQVHATDPDSLEFQLGRPRSKGCIRIPASLNRFLDHYGLIDAEYERAAGEGRHLWVLRADRAPVASAGKYLVVIDSGRNIRPSWSPWPPRRDRISSRRPSTGVNPASQIQDQNQRGKLPGRESHVLDDSSTC